MRILRSVAAIAVGLGFMAATVRTGTLVASGLIGGAPGAGNPSPIATATYLYVNLAICGIGAILGGWLAARVASFAPYGHAAVMAAVVAVLSITTVTGAPAPSYPGWYPSALGFVAVLGVLLGGKVRAAASAAGPVVA
jgi:hypothetical protein